ACALRFCSYSSIKLTGRRASGVLIWLLRTKSEYVNPDRKWGMGLPLESRVIKVELVIPLGAKTHGGKAGPPKTLEQPGPSPGTLPLFVPVGLRPVVVACTAKADACRIASGRTHFKNVY